MSSIESDCKNKPTASLKKTKWKTIKTDLQSALNEWSALENLEPQKSPEEEQLEKMKSMIENIKDKLNEF